MERPTARSEALRRAAAALGGVPRLAEALRMPVRQTQRWIAGEENPPLEAYQRALDLLIAVGAS
jgi:hypothetical protein